MSVVPPKIRFRLSPISLLQIGVAIGLFALLAVYIDFATVVGQIRQADPVAFVGATALILLQHVFTAFRWQIAANAAGFKLPFRLALSAYLEANFFNQALPSTIGGDAVRAWRATRAGASIGMSVLSVLADRAIGLLTLALLATYGALRLYQVPQTEQAGLALLAIIAMIAAAAIAGSMLSTYLPQFATWPIVRLVWSLSESVKCIFITPRFAIGAALNSFAGHILTVFAFGLLASAIGHPIDFSTALATLPAILLASVVPFSISGWGMRESAGVFMLMQFGLSAPDALALSILFGLSLVVLGIVGGIVWLLSGRIAGEASSATPAVVGVSDHVSQMVPMNIERRPSDNGTALAAAASPRKASILAYAEANAVTRDQWIADNPGYFGDDRRFMQFLIPEGSRVLVLGCSTGDLLMKLRPSRGVGVDMSPKMIEIARRNYPDFEFVVGDAEDPAIIAGLTGPFDFIVLSDTIGLYDDIEGALGILHRLCTRDTRIVIAYYSHLWQPLVYLADTLRLRPREPNANFISTTDFENLLALSDLEPIRMDWRQLLPYRLLGLGTFINRFIGTLPLIRRLCLRRYIVARSLLSATPDDLSVSILIPCRNEKGNIEPAVKRLPRFGRRQEIVFVEGNSGDGTYEECLRVQAAYGGVNIKVVKQPGRGKGDAMRTAYAAATGDVLMILDADLTVPPEMLPRFHAAIASGKADFVNGSRLIYPMEKEAMRPLNFIANRAFALIFTFLLNQRFTDTLCGTKVFRRDSYDRISRGRSYFGDFDPFGDFDLIFGATKQNLKIVEVPVPYKARTYGETQISRFRDGFLLLRMVLFAWRKLKAI